MSVTARRTLISDFEVLRDAVQDASLDIMQLGRGRMDGSLLHLAFDSGVGVSTGEFTRAVRSRGSLGGQRWGIGIVFDAPALMNHVESLPGEIIIFRPNHDIHARHFGASGYGTVFITPEELFGYPGAAEAAMLHQPNAVLPDDPAAAAARVHTFRWLLSEISTAAPTMSAGAAEFFRHAFVELVIGPMLERVEYRKPRIHQSTAKLVRAVEQYLIEANDRPVHSYELTKAFGIDLGSLQRVFKDETGLGLIAYQRRQRLSNVHTRLRFGGPDPALSEADLLIKDIAKEHGFIHYSGFTRQYQELFGEKPSHTVRRGRRQSASAGIFRAPNTREPMARIRQLIERSNTLLKDAPDTFLGNGARKKTDEDD
ncbi:helix-turn-helix domain-containing protein [Bradyrhizobium neotropicale]|uniref:AraC family transcriptional regulator n=1 Tax=Bradyrhizobium neotropicale TaxID=1497615 RepID=UPI001AD6235F|nr:helix-turn-helix domain-containing protein [Bradyrhizobium neotropicale]MBO4228357.1 helix-turn-helix domain-containing protein [Bradyrhizobium neotropicale]